VLVLQHVRSDWSRRRLLQLLEDPSQTVREMAALGLAIHGDSTATPEIKRLYTEGDDSAASAACLALERLATPEAIAALAELARQPATATRRVALVDALTGIGTARCVGPLLELLRDHRPCAVPSRAEQLLERFAPLAVEHGFIERPPSQPTSQRAAETVAERAAAALTHITGLSAPFASDLSEEQREEAVRLWREWAATHGAAP
jgi:HEAT repeat protein